MCSRSLNCATIWNERQRLLASNRRRTDREFSELRNDEQWHCAMAQRSQSAPPAVQALYSTVHTQPLVHTCSAFGNSSVRMTSSSRSDVVSNFLACEFSPDSSDVIDETIDANTDAA
jgi:hypothetical protein